MASSIINWIIDKYLNNILEINKDLTKSSILTGEIQMENLKIKPEIFTLLDLPYFELVHGYVGKLRIKVKLPRIHLHPIRVEIENVFFHAKQKKLSDINKEGEIKFMEGYKNSSLQILEEFKNELNNFEDELNPKVLSKIINNIEIYIYNICMRFDDDISYVLTPFCFGAIIKNIKFKTVDKDFKEVEGKYSIPFGEINNKIVQVDNLSVFLDTFENEGKLFEYNTRIIDTTNTRIYDIKFGNFLGPMKDFYRYCLTEVYESIKDINSHHYILFNLKLLLKGSINENLKNGKPKFMASLQSEQIKIGINLIQLKAIIKLTIYQNLMLKYQSGLSKEYYTKVLTEKEKMEYIDNYISYHKFMYGKKPNEKKGKSIKAILSKVEEKLKYEEIQIMRNAAESKMTHINELEEIEKKLKELKSEGKFFKRISFKKRNKEEEEEKEKEKKKLIEELEQKKSQLEKKISDIIKNRLEHIELLSGLFPDASGNFSLLTAKLEINEIQINVNRDQEEKLFSLILTKLNAFSDLKNREQNIKATINDMSLMQYQLPESKYPMIMSTVEQKNEDFNEEEKEEINAFDVELNINPDFEKSNYKIKFRNQKRIVIITNIYSLQFISKKITDYMTFFMDKNFDFPEKYNCSGEIYKFIKDGFKYDALEVGFQHFNADLDVTIKSPIILFPIDILDNLNKKYILIRCGDFHINSVLPPREDKNINYNEVKEREKLIDTYILKSEKLCVTTLDNFDGDLDELLDAQGLNLIEDVSFDLYADLLFAYKNENFEKFKIGMNIGKCRINIRDRQLPFIMELIQNSGKILKLAMYKLENKTYFEKKEIKFNKEEEEAFNINNKNKNKILEIKNEENIPIVNEIDLETFLLDEKDDEGADNNKEEKKEEGENEENKEEEKKEGAKQEEENNVEIKNGELDEKKENIVESKEKNKEEINKEDENIEIKKENEILLENKIEYKFEDNKMEGKNEEVKNEDEKKEEIIKEEENKEKDKKDENNELKENKEGNNNIENKNINELNKEDEKKDSKLLTFNFKLENFQFCLQKTISYEEKEILSNTNEEDLQNLVYRDFIIFDMNTFKIELFLSEKFNANATLLIKSIGIIDKETLITNANNPKGDLYIDREFQHIIKMDSGKSRNEDRNSSNPNNREFSHDDSVAITDLNELNKEKNINQANNKKENYDDYFMILNFIHNNENQTQYADILLKKIKICIAMSTVSRVLQFSFYYLEMFNKIIEKNLIILNKIEMEHKKEKLKNKMIRKLSRKSILNKTNSSENLNLSINNDLEEDSDSDEEMEFEDSNKLFDSNFASQLAKDIKNKQKEDEKNLLLISTSPIKDNNHKELDLFRTYSSSSSINIDMDKEAEQTLKNKEIKLSKIFRTKNAKLNIKIKIEMKETSILFPLDDTKSNTTVLRLKSNINGNIYFKTDIDLIRNGNDKLVKINFNENNIKTGIKIFNVEFGILNYQNGIYSIDNICDTILTGFRLCLNINSRLLLPEKEQTLTLGNIDLEPLVFNIGFTQIKAFIKFMPILFDFLADIKKEYDDPIKEFEDFEDIEQDINYNNINNENNNINNENNINIIKNDDLNNISTSPKENEIINININEEEENKKLRDSQKLDKFRIRRLTRRKNKEKKKLKKISEDKVEINILNMNNTIDVKVNIEKTLIKIIDNSGLYLQPFLNIEFREIPIKFILNTNSDSVDNISNLLVESISHKEIPIYEYDIKYLSLYGEINFCFSITFYNKRIEDWEPIIEKYGATITLDQITWFSRLRFLYISNDMFNINISFSILSIVNDLLKKFLGKKEKIRKLSDNITSNIDDNIAIEFVNLTGIDISCWLDAQDTTKNLEDLNYKFNLDSNTKSKSSNNKKMIKRNKLNKIYQKLTDAQLKIKKDKFSFKVKGFIPITSNDFSSNYTTCFKLKKDVKENNVDDNFNINIENFEKNENDYINEDENNSLKEELLPQSGNSSRNDSLIFLNEDNEDQDIEIFIKVRKNGSLKSIVFESNTFFYNNLQIPISLSLISQRDYNYKYNYHDKLIDHNNNKDKIIINSGRKKSLSLKYLIKKYRIYISFHDNSNKEKYNYSLLYENFDCLKNNYQNFIKYEKENLPTYKGRKETELNDYYSKLISVNHKDKNFYICSNLIIQHGSNDIIKDISNQPNESNKISENSTQKNIINKVENIININLISDTPHSKGFSYLFILNESLVIENQLPFNIKCMMDGNIKKEVSIRPLQNKYFLDIDQDNTQLKLVLKYQKKIFESDFFDIKSIGQNENQNQDIDTSSKKELKNEDIEITVNLYEKENNEINKNKYIECSIKLEENIDTGKLVDAGAYEKEFEKNVKSFSKKRKIIIYNKCLIINKTDFLLYMKSDDIKVQNFDMQNYNGKIYPNTVNILNTNNVKNTFKLKSENSDWSNKFNINTIGHMGVISLEINQDNNNKIIDLELSVSISSSWNFPNSLFITIEPRFLLINKFGYDLQYKQYNNRKNRANNDNGNQFPSKIIKNGQEFKLNLLKGDKNMKRMIQIKMGEFSDFYSCPVNLDEIGDVDLKIPINEEMKQKIIKKNMDIDKKIEKLKKKERLKKKLAYIEEKKEEEEDDDDEGNKILEEEKRKIEEEKKKLEEEYKQTLLNEDNNKNITNDNDEYESVGNSSSTNLEKILNINHLINNNNNINNENSQNKNDGKLGLLDPDDDEMSIESFSFLNKSEKFLSRRRLKELSPIQEKLKKLEERNKKLKEVQMRPRKYYIFNQNNESYLLIRVTKSIYKGLIYIVIFPPENPQYLIKNQTDFNISIKQKKDTFYEENIILEKGGIMPYSWGDTLKNDKILCVSINNNDVEINLNEIKVITKQLIKKNKNNSNAINQKARDKRSEFFFQTVIENNRTRTLIIKGSHQKEKYKGSFLERIKDKRNNSFNIKVKLYTKGIGMSIINGEPRELFYISFYGILIDAQLFSFNKEHCSHIIANLKLSLKNFQIDYCLKDVFKSMIIPKNQITPQIEELNIVNNINNLSNSTFVPLFQGIISFHRTTNQLISVSSDEFPQLDFTVQPIKVNVSNYQLMSLLDFGLQLKSEFDFYLTEPEKSKRFDNIEDLEKFLFDKNLNYNDIAEYDPDHYDSLLDPNLTILPEEIIFNSEKHYMFFIKNIAIGSLVIILTTRIDLNSIPLIPTIFSGLSSFIGNIFTHITDYNLNLPSLYYTDVFTDILTLGTQLTNSYLSQLKKRIFKIVGSLDILGNPTSYAASLGQGFLEIVEAPRRGLINGPLGFGEGVAKGFGTFITTLITSSLDIVGKISGTLLASCEELQGIKNTEYLSESEPSNVISGLYYGVKNGIIDIGKGFAGIFIKPYKEAKKSGIGGFFQGIGAGLIGAAVSPVTAGLRIANNLIIGIKNTALIFNPQLKNERFRYPRTIQKAIRLNSYDEDEALIHAILDYLGGYNGHEIIYFKQFKYIYPGLQSSFSTLILTDKCVMIVYQAKELVFKIDLNLIRRVEVYKEPNNTNYDLIFYLRNNTRKYIVTNDLSLCIEFYLLFENVK